MEKQPRSGPIQECLLSGGNCVFNTYMVNADSEVDFREYLYLSTVGPNTS